MSDWWKRYPKREKREIMYQPEGARPELREGAVIRLKGKPELLRKVLRADWHFFRYQFVYIVETSAVNKEPYWFLDQLEIIHE